MCGEVAPCIFVARPIALHSIATAHKEGEKKDSALFLLCACVDEMKPMDRVMKSRDTASSYIDLEGFFFNSKTTADISK